MTVTVSAALEEPEEDRSKAGREATREPTCGCGPSSGTAEPRPWTQQWDVQARRPDTQAGEQEGLGSDGLSSQKHGGDLRAMQTAVGCWFEGRKTLEQLPRKEAPWSPLPSEGKQCLPPTKAVAGGQEQHRQHRRRRGLRVLSGRAR